jgi:hypothetical protein
MRIVAAAAFASLAVSAWFAGSAQAITVTFDGGAMDLGPAIKGADILDADPATAGHQNGPGLIVNATPTGAPNAAGDVPLAIAAGDAGWNFPTWSTSSAGFNITADLVLNAPGATATYNIGTGTGPGGVLTTNAMPLKAVITTQAQSPPGSPTNHCTITPPGGLTFSTENTNAQGGDFLAQRFAPPLDITTATGSVTTLWSDLPNAVADPGEDCTLINALIHGRGGVWLGKGLGPAGYTRKPTPPASGGGSTTTPPPAKKKKKCKKPKKHSAAAAKKCKKKN